MRVLYNYKAYDKPKKARYIRTGREYCIDKVTGRMGWEKIEVETIVIGEDDHSYIEELKEFRCCDTSEPDYGEVVLLPHGFHKSRLLEWVELPDQQLELINNPNAPNTLRAVELNMLPSLVIEIVRSF